MSRVGRIARVPRPSRLIGSLAARLGPPAIAPTTVSQILDRYGLHARDRPQNLPRGHRSRNVVVRTDQGVKVLKRYRPQWDPPRVGYGHSILVRLEDLRFPAPRLVRLPDEGTWTIVDGDIFALFDFLPGTVYSMSYVRRSNRRRLIETSARTLAGFHRALDGFVPRGTHHLGFVSATGPRALDAAWYAATVHELKELSDDLGDGAAECRRLADRATRALDEIEELGATLAAARLPRLVIHGDYGLHNLIFQARDLAVPVDLELSRLDWRLNDLIHVFAGCLDGRADEHDVRTMEQFARAYACEFPLKADEARVLFEAWRLSTLQSAVRHWNSAFQTDRRTAQLASAVRSIDRADWIIRRPEVVRRLREAVGGGGRSGQRSGPRSERSPTTAEPVDA
jgi:Ser/Thr protein kinase RdoA (MazF antagonist)